ncbi:hypothetical protein PLEOSDRAFT_1113654 [Pleurotus ostreatus PC15]|uniref:F-box domain-containing protein n=1 Tax=Pleurotus ostreatus (strain PC15) TaxID=1137138 RepID=A0A067NQT6_PLEO1|nr:hypothetical protein PLEOSDRAFT_1113654 [Pleurotus ostreatus PC15]
MPFYLFSLPPELITRILLHARIQDVIRCLQVNTSLRDLIRNTLILQYSIDAHFAGAEVLNGTDIDILTDTTLAERVSHLKERETAWRILRPDFRERINVLHTASGIYDLSGGIYFLGEAISHDSMLDRMQTVGLRYLRLPNKMFEESKWESIEVEAPIVDIGLSVYEHDLIAVITTSTESSVDITFTQISTSKPHPLAKQPKIRCHQIAPDSGRLAISIEIVGKYLALILTFPNAGVDVVDRFFVYEWMEGKLVIDHPAPASSVYTSLVFLSPTVLVVASTHPPASLDIWDLELACSVRSLLLPALQPHMEYRSISARGEPNPYLSHSRDTSFQPKVFYDPKESIVVFNVHIQISNGLSWRSALVVVHRRALLEAGRRAGGAEKAVRYAEWGQKTTRWIPASELSTRWITTSAGQRMAVIHDTRGFRMVDRSGAEGIRIYDFNPFHVRKWGQEVDDAKARWAAGVAEPNAYEGDVSDPWDGWDDNGDTDDEEEEEEEGNNDLYGHEDLDDEDFDEDAVETLGFAQVMDEELGDAEALVDMVNQFIASAEDGSPPIEPPLHFNLPTDSDSGGDDEIGEGSLHSTLSSPRSTTSSPGPSTTRVPHPPSAPGLQRNDSKAVPNMRIVTSPSTIFANGAVLTFEEPVVCELPCVVYTPANPASCGGLTGMYEGMLLDEERMLGLKTDELDNIVAIDVFHFG